MFLRKLLYTRNIKDKILKKERRKLNEKIFKTYPGGGGILFVLIVSILVIYNKNNNEEIQVITNNNIDKEIFAFNIENDSNEYEKVKSIPSAGYKINLEKSFCGTKKEDGTYTKEAVEITYQNSKITIDKVNKYGMRCFLYFDIAFEGDGSSTNPYILQSIEDLVRLSNYVSIGNTYQDKYFILNKDLDFKNVSDYENSTSKVFGDINDDGEISDIKTELTTGSGFTPIGNTSYRFEGNVDGESHEVKNLYINNTKNIHIGLFGIVGNNEISNLGVSGEVKTSVAVDAGGLIASANSSKITNCYNKANVSSERGSNSIGGILGFAGGTKVTITDSYNSGNISNSNNTGGLVGYVSSATTLEINNSYNTGTITNNLGSYAGGLVGRDNASTSSIIIKNSYNAGSVSSNFSGGISRIGGLVGRSIGTLSISNSNNSGEINSPLVDTIGYESSIGGITGVVNGKTTIENTYNSGNVNGGIRTAGIIGYAANSTSIILNKVYNSGNITSDLVHNNGWDTTVGGMISYNYKSNVNIINSYNAGIVHSIKSVAGIVGSANQGGTTHIINSFNIGNIDHKPQHHISGIINAYSDGNIVNTIHLNNVYNIGELTGSNINGVGFINANNTYNISNSYYVNNITGSNLSEYVTGKTLAEIKSSGFVNTLNNNVNNINLSEIDSNLEGYTLSKWKLGTNGYPILDI